MSWGRPRLLLPNGREPRSDWFAIFCHELAHLARRDGWSRLAVEAVTIALPWQPLVWVVRRDFRAACEEACDDWAIASGADPVEFASLLLDFVPQARTALVLGMAESVSAARARIVRLLAMQDLPRPRLGRLLGVGGWLVAMAPSGDPGPVASGPIPVGRERLAAVGKCAGQHGSRVRQRGRRRIAHRLNPIRSTPLTSC